MKATFGNLEISSKYLGNKPRFDMGFFNRNNPNYNNHRIVVKNIETKKWCSFEFWASIAQPEIKTKKQLLEAFECFINDVMAGQMDFEDFVFEFGHGIKNPKKLYNACVAAANKYEKVIGDENVYKINRILINYIEKL